MTDLDMESMVAEATAELEKGYQQIQFNTSLKWAARAVAAFRMSMEAETAGLAVGLYENGCEYANEALEHASALEDGQYLENLASYLAVEKNKAFNDLVSASEEPQENIDQAVEEQNTEPKEEKPEEEPKEEVKDETQQESDS